MENVITDKGEPQEPDILSRVRKLEPNPGCRPECDDCVHQLDVDADPSLDNPCGVFVGDLADDHTIRPGHSHRADGSIECTEHVSRQEKGMNPNADAQKC